MKQSQIFGRNVSALKRLPRFFLDRTENNTTNNKPIGITSNIGPSVNSAIRDWYWYRQITRQCALPPLRQNKVNQPLFYPLYSIIHPPTTYYKFGPGGCRPPDMRRTPSQPPIIGGRCKLERYVPAASCAGKLLLTVSMVHYGDVHFSKDHCCTLSYIP